MRCPAGLIFALLVFASGTLVAGETAREIQLTARQWEPVDVEARAADRHAWWAFPVRAVFRHEPGGEQHEVEGFWDGGNRWVIRFTAPLPGEWTFHTSSRDRGLDGLSGRVMVKAPSAAERAANPNFRGLIRIAPNGRHFEYADGTPFFLLADTLWAVNTARCAVGDGQDGPLIEYLDDRRQKGFTAILMQYFHGYGDYPTSPGHRNEGGYTFLDRDPARLNPAHFAGLDARMRALWRHGFVAAVNATWWGKTRDCIFTPEDAARISAYCAVRYGGFNALWSLSGEYQYTFKDCGWTPADISALGVVVQSHNPTRRPLSIHPSSRLNFSPPHNVQSSRAFHGEPWLDHHWLQTGQSTDRLFNIVGRLRENRALTPTMPVFLSEARYEQAGEPDAAYLVRWQVWTGFLNGAAGYGYGAWGMWQFFDPADPAGESGKDLNRAVPWREAMQLPGSRAVKPAKSLLTTFDWWTFQPQRDRLRVNGRANPLPTPTDLSPPQAAAIGKDVTLIYLPRGNDHRAIELESRGGGRAGEARWFDPRRGEYSGEPIPVKAAPSWTLPARPQPGEDWVLVLTAQR